MSSLLIEGESEVGQASCDEYLDRLYISVSFNSSEQRVVCLVEQPCGWSAQPQPRANGMALSVVGPLEWDV